MLRTRLRLVVLGCGLIASSVFFGLQYSLTAQDREFAYVDVENLIFGTSPGTFRTRPMVSTVPVVQVSLGASVYSSSGTLPLNKLVQKITAVTQVKFEETSSLTTANATVGLFYPEYRTGEEFQVWLEAADEFAREILKRRRGSALDPSLPATQALASFADRRIREEHAAEMSGLNRSAEIAADGDPSKQLQGHAACETGYHYNVVAYKNAVAVFASYDHSAAEFDMIGCLIRPFLNVAGLKNVNDYPSSQLIAYEHGNYRLSSLVVCALGVVYAPEMDAPGSGANTAISRAHQAFTNQADCH